MNAPLETTESYYAKLRPGSKAWKNYQPAPVFPLICSKETSERILNGAKKKKGAKAK